MNLEEATATNIREYSLVGQFFRAKLVHKMLCNKKYIVFAIEYSPGVIYKIYAWGEAAKEKNVGDIFYIKLARQIDMDDLSRLYDYYLCDEKGNVLISDRERNLFFNENFFDIDYSNHF